MSFCLFSARKSTIATASLRDLAEFIIAKQRSRVTGIANMVFLAGQQRFESRAEDGYGIEE